MIIDDSLVPQKEYDRLKRKQENTHERSLCWYKEVRYQRRIISRRDKNIIELKLALKKSEDKFTDHLKGEKEKVDKAAKDKKNTEKIKRHRYGLTDVKLFISIVLLCSIALRGTEKSLKTMFDIMQYDMKVPSWKTGSSWIKKLGYYKLHNVKLNKSRDWIWMLDHSIQSGGEKCLLVLGIQKSKIPKHRALCRDDMTVLSMIIMKESNGELINEVLEGLCKLHGIIPRQIISDEGSDLIKGIGLFCKSHKKTISSLDIKHKVANWYKANISKRTDWIDYTSECAALKNKLKQTKFAGLCPPKMKSKARYMNIPEISYWGKKMLLLLEHGCDLYTKDELEYKVGWVKKYETVINECTETHDVADKIESHLRTQYMTLYTGITLNKMIDIKGLSDQSLKFRTDILAFVGQQSRSLRPNERLLPSTEIIESIFGNLKRISGQHTMAGFSAMTLAIPALVGGFNDETIKLALESVTNKDVKKWAKKNIGLSIQSDKNKIGCRIRKITSASSFK
jgi:hypothetical protein